MTRLAAHAREAVGQDAAAQVRRELAVDMARQAAVIGVAQLRQQGLGVAGYQLVQDRTLGRTALVATRQRLPGGAGRSFVDAACEHVRAV